MAAERRKARRKTEKNRRRSSGVLAKLAIMLAVVAAVVFGVAIFFKVNTIEVQGNSVYSAQDVIAASDLAVGDNLLTVNKDTAAGNIMARLPYIESVSIGRSLPDTVVIQVREGQSAFAVNSETNTVWLVSPQGKALERADTEMLEQYPQIMGVVLNSPTAGQPVTSLDQKKLDAAIAVLTGLEGTGILEHVAAINVEKEYDIVLQYEDRYEIKLGGTDDLTYKIQYLTAILSELSDFQAGTIDLSFQEGSKAWFYPKQ